MTPKVGGGNQTTPEARRQSSVDIRTVLGFLGLTFIISWCGVTALYLVGIDLGSASGQGMATIAFMGAPAFAALAILITSGDSIRKNCGLYLGRQRWIVLGLQFPDDPVGVVGIVAALVGIVVCVAHDRLRADERITTGGPLSPWSRQEVMR